MELTVFLLIFIHYQNINLRRQLSDILLFEDGYVDMLNVDTLTITSTFNPIKFTAPSPDHPRKSRQNSCLVRKTSFHSIEVKLHKIFAIIIKIYLHYLHLQDEDNPLYTKKQSQFLQVISSKVTWHFQVSYRDQKLNLPPLLTSRYITTRKTQSHYFTGQICWYKASFSKPSEKLM